MARLDHAQPRPGMSIPRGVGAPPPPGLDPKRGKLMCIKVRLLDDSIAVFHLGHKALGQTLLDEVARHLNLLESDYFGLEYIDETKSRVWLEKEKPILRQIAAAGVDAKFYFIVKFYSPNPVDLEEEYTRYLFTLQIRRDLAHGELQCAETTAALLAAYLVQSDCGDFSPEDYPDANYLSHARFVPNQTMAFQQLVMNNHKNLVGMNPAESDLALLEVARRCDFYGVKLHSMKDLYQNEGHLAVMHLGIKVFQQLHCVSTFSWAKIRKLSFKRKKLLIKLHPDNYYNKETAEFVFDTRNECKNFWKKCVEHHAFFRCSAVDNLRRDHRFFSKGSSFRYSGRTQKQLIDYVREHHKRREPFTRPLRSATSQPRPYSTATMISDRQRNGHTHASMPHLPPPEVLDARNQRRRDRCTSDVERDHPRASPRRDAPPPTTRETEKPIRKRDVIYGVNSTFSAEDVTEPSSFILKCSLSTSATSERLKRVESSDSGGFSLYQSTTEKTEHSGGQTLDELEPETSSEQSENYLERDDSLLGRRAFSRWHNSLPRIMKDLHDQERTSYRDVCLVSQKLYEAVQPQLEKCRVLAEMFTALNELRDGQNMLKEEFTDMAKNSRWEEVPSALLRSAHNSIPIYQSLLQQFPIYLSALDELSRQNVAFRAQLLKLESSEECYLPINWLLLRITHRMVWWQSVLARIVEQQLEEGKEEKEVISARVTLDKVSQYAEKSKKQRLSLAEFVTMLQVEKDVGRPGLLSHPNRRLLRLGWVDRWSQSGVNPRIVLLTSDRILFAHRTPGEPPFSVHAEFRLKGLLVEDGDTYGVTGSTDTVTLHSGDKSVVFLSQNREEWVEDISGAVKAAAKTRLEPPPIQLEKREESDIVQINRKELDSLKTKPSPLQVCWHRKCSLGVSDMHRIASVGRSGYLLRKLRNSSGWQRLWVILAGHSLFFYKSHEDASPLANLSLVDYGLGIPTLDDTVSQENCFKLFYANYRYYFRTENEYSLDRWMDAIKTTAINRKNIDIITSLSLRI